MEDTPEDDTRSDKRISGEKASTRDPEFERMRMAIRESESRLRQEHEQAREQIEQKVSRRERLVVWLSLLVVLAGGYFLLQRSELENTNKALSKVASELSGVQTELEMYKGLVARATNDKTFLESQINQLKANLSEVLLEVEKSKAQVAELEHRGAVRSVSPAENQERFVRTPHMDVPTDQPLQAGSEFKVSVYLNQVAFQPGEAGAAINIPFEETEESMSLSVWLDGSDHFAVIGPTVQKLTIKREQDASTLAVFQLRVSEKAKTLKDATLTANVVSNK